MFRRKPDASIERGLAIYDSKGRCYGEEDIAKLMALINKAAEKGVDPMAWLEATIATDCNPEEKP